MDEITLRLIANYLFPLLEGACVVITFAFITFRIPVLRQGLLQYPHSILGTSLLLVLFSAFSIYGTYAGMVISPNQLPTPLLGYPTGTLEQGAAILNFRDMPVVAAGLLMGPWVGLSVGSIAGFERYLHGGFTAEACGLATLLIGLLAGLAHHHSRGRVSPRYAFLIASIGTMLQKTLILLLGPYDMAIQLVQKTTLPMWLINAGGCYLLIYIIRSLDSERREKLAYFRAQIEPHFLLNTLNAIRSLIRIDPDDARQYVTRFGRFMQATQRYATEYTVTISEELKQLERYVAFQQLRFPKKISIRTDISKDFPTDYKLPPRTLLTLVENSMTHGRDKSRSLNVQLRLYQTNQHNIIEVQDDGTGIPPNKVKQLGTAIVPSNHPGGGSAIYNLVQILRLSYGIDASLKIQSEERKGTLIRLCLPSQPN